MGGCLPRKRHRSLLTPFQFWGTESGRLLRSIECDALAISVFPDGNRIAIATEQALTIWNVESGVQEKSILTGTGPANGLSVCPAGKQLITGHGDGTARIWDIDSGNVTNLPSHADRVTHVAFSRTGNLVATASWDSTAQISTVDGEPIHELAAHDEGLIGLAFSWDDTLLATASQDRRVILWDVESGEPMRKLRGHSDAVWCVDFAPDGRLATGGTDQTIKIWSGNVSTQVTTIPACEGRVYDLNFHPDGRRILASGEDDTTKVWELEMLGESVVLANLGSEKVTDLVLSPDGSHVALGSEIGRIQVLLADNGTCLLDHLHTSEITSLAFSSDGRLVFAGTLAGQILICSVNDKKVQTFDISTGTAVSRIALSTHSFDGLVLMMGDGSVGKWRARSSEIDFTGMGSTRTVSAVAVRPHHAEVATYGRDGQLRVSDLKSGQLLIPPIETDGIAQSGAVAYSADGELLAVTSLEEVRVVDAQTGELLTKLRGHFKSADDISFSPDKTRIVTCSADATIKLWDASTGLELLMLRGHIDDVTSVAFSPSGDRVYSSSWDGTVRSWLATRQND